MAVPSLPTHMRQRKPTLAGIVTNPGLQIPGTPQYRHTQPLHGLQDYQPSMTGAPACLHTCALANPLVLQGDLVIKGHPYVIGTHTILQEGHIKAPQQPVPIIRNHLQATQAASCPVGRVPACCPYQLGGCMQALARSD